jgi:serine/threonine-protein kinase
MANGTPDSAESLQTGKYRVLLELGQGGTANVYLAVAHGPSGFNKLVVLKALKSSLGSDPEFRRMFLNEARLSARLNHPNIVQVNEVIEHDGLPVIVMEYLDGKPLSEIRARAEGSLLLHMHLRMLSEALSGLHYSHELADYDGTPLNVVHRDFTPHNIFVTYDGQVKILDFGIAKLSGSLVETQTGVIKGKLRYMPPEQITGDAIDRRADVFAAGVMVWEAAAGTRMWGAMSEAAIMNRVLNGDIPSPRTVRTDVSPDLERICMKALADDPDARYATAAELQADIDEFLGHLSATITLREMGQFVTSYFEDSRVQTRRIIDQHLSKASAAAVDHKAPITFPPPPMSHTRAAYTTSSTIANLPSDRSRRRRRVLTLVAGALVAVVGFATWQVISARKTPDALEPTRQVAATPTAAPTTMGPQGVPAAGTQRKEILLRVTAFPLAAEITLDGAPLPGNPYAGAVPADGVEHRIEATAPGFETASKVATFRPDMDVDVVLSLTPDKPQRKRGVIRPPVVGPKPTAQERTGPDCTPPYYVDERGVKKFKTGCL